MESLSSYARQFLGQMEKPDVDYIEGLSPAISIDQKTTSRNPRSTVGTVTEIHDYLRLMYARIGVPHCPKCGKPIRQQTVDQIVDQILALPERTKLMILAPVVRGRKGEFVKLLEDMQKQGYVRARIDGELYELSDLPKLAKTKKHTVEIVIDRLVVRPDIQQRLTDSVETASALSGGLVTVNLVQQGEDIHFSQNYACDDCGISIEELAPRMFSFNNPFGACPTCTGLGMQLKADPGLIVPDETLSILDGAIAASGWQSIRSDGISRMYFDALARKYAFSLSTPWERLSDRVKDVILYGTGGEKLTQVNAIVIHYVGNPNTTAWQNRSYFANLAETGETSASSNLIVGMEGETILCVPLDEVAYCSNDRNHDTISIEFCHPSEDGKPTQATYDALVKLTAWLCDTFSLKGDTDVIRHYDVIGKECAAVGVRQVFSPVVNLVRDCRWGRTVETFGEDVRLCADMGAAMCRGLQKNGVIATPKHFADNYASGGRDSNYSETSERTMREVFLPPFKACFEIKSLFKEM